MVSTDLFGHGEEPDFVDWLRRLDPDELAGYRVELEAFAGDPTRFGAFAAAALPMVQAVADDNACREYLRPTWEQVFPEDPLDELWPHLRAIVRGKRQLGVEIGLDTYVAALDTARALNNDETRKDDQDG